MQRLSEPDYREREEPPDFFAELLREAAPDDLLALIPAFDAPAFLLAAPEAFEREAVAFAPPFAAVALLPAPLLLALLFFAGVLRLTELRPAAAAPFFAEVPFEVPFFAATLVFFAGDLLDAVALFLLPLLFDALTDVAPLLRDADDFAPPALPAALLLVAIVPPLLLVAFKLLRPSILPAHCTLCDVLSRDSDFTLAGWR